MTVTSRLWRPWRHACDDRDVTLVTTVTSPPVATWRYGPPAWCLLYSWKRTCTDTTAMSEKCQLQTCTMRSEQVNPV